jgi:hypothetical protein
MIKKGCCGANYVVLKAKWYADGISNLLWFHYREGLLA